MHGTVVDRDQFIAPHHPEPPASRCIPACVQGDAITIAEALLLSYRTRGLQHVSPALQDALQIPLLLRDACNHGQRAMAAATALGLAAGGHCFLYAHASMVRRFALHRQGTPGP